MPVWIVIGVAAAIFVLVIVVAASFNVFSSETRDEAAERWTGLPEAFTSTDLETVTFRPALRGYRMDDVDEAMALLHDRLRELEAAAEQYSAAGDSAAPTDQQAVPPGDSTAAAAEASNAAAQAPDTTTEPR
jgi:DivIVA domain-containing protein